MFTFVFWGGYVRVQSETAGSFGGSGLRWFQEPQALKASDLRLFVVWGDLRFWGFRRSVAPLSSRPVLTRAAAWEHHSM